MRPNLNTHKKRHGTFMHPGSTGFKFQSTSLKSRFGNSLLPRMASACVVALVMFLAVATFFNPIIASVVGFGYIAMAAFTKMPVGILGTGAVAGTEEEKALMLKFKTESDSAISKALAQFKETDEAYKAIKTMQETLAKMKPEDAEAAKKAAEKLRSDLDSLGIKLKALEEAPKNLQGFKKGSIAETLTSHKAAIDKFLAKQGGSSLMIEHKATMTSTDIDGRENYFTWHQGGAVGQIPVRRPFMRELFTNISTSTEYVKYIDQETVVRDAKNVALCGTTTSNTKLTWKTRDLKVDKVRDFTNICLDMMNDYSFVEGEINRLLNTSLQLKIDNDLLLGTGVSPILHGLDEIASTFDAAASGADYSNTVVNPNLIDLISIAGAQIKAFGQQNMFFPNYVLINPRDLQGLKFLKDDVNNYIKNSQLFSSLFQDAGGKYYIDGMLLVENPLVPENEFYIGDFTKGTVYQRPGVGIEFAYENGTNFETETVTVKVYERLNLLVRNVDANAFMHCEDIEAALVAITYSVGP